MHIINPERFRQALHEKGYRSIGELARRVGIHRNTIHYYLSGNDVFPEKLEQIMAALDLDPSDLIKKTPSPQLPRVAPIAPIIDTLVSEFPAVTFILFGSRATGKNRKYSDWDIGVTKKGVLDHEEHRKISIRCDDLTEDFPYFVQIVNLDRADRDFLRCASQGWKFLAGHLENWVDLHKRVPQ